MYEQFFGLKSRPFSATPYIQNYFPSDSIHHAMCQTRLTIERGSGPAIVTGGPGTGKSLLMAVLSDYFKETLQVVNLMCANVSERRDLLQALLHELKLPYQQMSESELRLSLIDAMRSCLHNSRSMLLLIDEAHTLSPDILDELRVISSFAEHGRAAVQLVLAGLPSLEDHLIETKSESLNQRIASRCYLTNLSGSEAFDYIVTHIERVGGNGETIFTGDAITTISELSEGCPRVINQICDYSLVLAASQQKRRVTAEMVAAAWNEVQSIPGTPLSAAPALTLCDKGDASSVLEFGTLDGEHENDSLSSDEIEPADDRAVALNTTNDASSQTIDDLAAPGQDLNVVDERVDDLIETQNVKSLNQSSSSPESPANPTIAQATPKEPTVNFENPFKEDFEEEETVFASFIPAVSEQNLNSLMITTDQLLLLESVAVEEPNIAEEIEKIASESAEASIESMSVEQSVDEISERSDLDELKMSEASLQGLESVEDDIRRLQQEMMQTQLSDSADHSTEPDAQPDQAPPLAESSMIEPLETAHLRHEDISPIYEIEPIIVSGIEDQIFTGRPSLELQNDNVQQSADDEMDRESRLKIPTTTPFEGEPTVQFERALSTKGEQPVDDRDIVVVRRASSASRTSASELDTICESHQPISTGRASRMNYHDLFRQLRSAE